MNAGTRHTTANLHMSKNVYNAHRWSKPKVSVPTIRRLLCVRPASDWSTSFAWKRFHSRSSAKRLERLRVLAERKERIYDILWWVAWKGRLILERRLREQIQNCSKHFPKNRLDLGLQLVSAASTCEVGSGRETKASKGIIWGPQPKLSPTEFHIRTKRTRVQCVRIHTETQVPHKSQNLGRKKESKEVTSDATCKHSVLNFLHDSFLTMCAVKSTANINPIDILKCWTAGPKIV